MRFPDEKHMSYPADSVTSPRLYYSKIFGRFYRKKLKMLCDCLPQNNIKKVLEIGFGSGIALKELSHRSKEVYAIDVHGDMEITKQMLINEGVTNVRLFCHDIFKDLFMITDQFDYVVSSSVFEHIAENNLESGIQHVHRCLKNDGFFLLGFPLKTKMMNTIFKIFEQTYQRIAKDIQQFSHAHHHPSGENEIYPVLKRYFIIEEERYFINRFFRLYVVLVCRKKSL